MAANKDAYYFSHDSNARNDIKMLRVRRKMGMAGVGLFWCVIEILREAVDHKLPSSHIEDVAYDLGCLPDQLTELLTEYDLFCFDGECFFSNRLLRSMQQRKELSEKRSAIGKKGGELSAATRKKSRGSKQLVNQSLSKGQAEVNLGSTIKGKEMEIESKKKENSSIGKIRSSFSKPSEAEVTEYFSERLGTNAADSLHPAKFFDYYEANGWKVGKNPMKDWKAAVRNWITNINKYEKNESNVNKSVNTTESTKPLGTSAARLEALRRW